MLKFAELAPVQPEAVTGRAAFHKNICGEIGVVETDQIRSVSGTAVHRIDDRSGSSQDIRIKQVDLIGFALLCPV
jgi:hypothetical protein